MRSLPVLALLSLASARVTFLYSEVLQAPDIAVSNRANFQCTTICKVYTDRKYVNLMITQQGNIIATFNTIVSGNTLAPVGVVLPAGDYTLENRGEPNPEFVLYIVQSTAPNYGAPVYAPQDTIGVTAAGPSRYATFLSSFETLWFSGFSGQFSPGYPAVYTTGYDAADQKCRPVYKARSQYNAEVSWPTIASAVFTVDFGYTGIHNVSVNQRKVDDLPLNGGTTTVYTSPGYVGCSFNSGLNYYSKLSSVDDSFRVSASSVDVDGTYDKITINEKLQFAVNGKSQVMTGSGNFTDHYNTKDYFDVSILWQRTTASSSFAVQLDFTGTTQPGAPSATNSPGWQSTTTSAESLRLLVAIALVIAACL